MVVFGLAAAANHVSTVDLAHTFNSSFNQSKLSSALYSCQELFQEFVFRCLIETRSSPRKLFFAEISGFCAQGSDLNRAICFSAHMRGTPPRTVIVSVIQPFLVQYSIYINIFFH